MSFLIALAVDGKRQHRAGLDGFIGTKQIFKPRSRGALFWRGDNAQGTISAEVRFKLARPHEEQNSAAYTRRLQLQQQAQRQGARKTLAGPWISHWDRFLSMASSLPFRTRTEAIGIQKHAHDILSILLETNAVGFPQDKATLQWMAGYYNNNAILRLSDMYSDPVALAVIKDVMPENVHETVIGWYRPERQSEFSKLAPTKQWELAFEGFEMTFRLLK
ncbi:hypothetical protein [Bradyrhizobium sp. Rc2d]|uniref:hypothetical protein n=1 Tax=Bradyrhizobium sp. Rc2d TaxID=1855321 RepID=UPI00115F7F57|nr:hypothetical protein [Bradyrhizobium sp. Rc2d]